MSAVTRQEKSRRDLHLDGSCIRTWPGLNGQRVGAGSILAFGRNQREPHLLADCSRKKAANGMRLPTSGSHQFRRSSSARAFQKLQHLDRLTSFAWTLRFRRATVPPFGAAGLVTPRSVRRRHVGRLLRHAGLLGGFRRSRTFRFFRIVGRRGCWTSGHRFSDLLPDADDGRFPIRELLHWRGAGQIIPDFEQARCRPFCGQLAQLLQTAEVWGLRVTLCILDRVQDADVVVVTDCKDSLWRGLLPR